MWTLKGLESHLERQLVAGVVKRPEKNSTGDFPRP